MPSDDQPPSDDDLRGTILETLYKHRYSDMVSFDTVFQPLPISFDVKKSILRQLEEKRLVEFTFKPLSELGGGRLTAYGMDVVAGRTTPPCLLCFTNITSRLTGHPVHRLAPPTYPTAMLEAKGLPLTTHGTMGQAHYLGC
jgi:hypothetical protein